MPNRGSLYRSLLLTFLLFAQLGAEIPLCERSEAFLLIGDGRSAQSLAEQAHKAQPQSAAVLELLTRVHAYQGNEREMLQSWKAYTENIPEHSHRRDLLEAMAWGVLNQGMKARVPLLRLYALYGAAQTQDAQAIKALIQAMRDPNEAVRATAVQLSLQFRDRCLIDEICALWKHEHSYFVRIELIQVAGMLKIEGLREELEKTLSSSAPEMQAVLLQSLVLMNEDMEDEPLSELLRNPRAPLRILACRLVTHLEKKALAPHLLDLAKTDVTAEVRAEALLALAYLRYEAPESYSLHLQDPHPQVRMAAAWALTLSDEEKGRIELERLLFHEQQETRLLTAAAIASAGPYGVSLALAHYDSHTDPFVRLNLAQGLLGQRQEVEGASLCLASLIEVADQRWQRQSTHPFSPLIPSRVKPHPLIPSYPEVVHQATQLELLNLLAIVEYPGAQNSIKEFLRKSPWGITSFASASLLQEGDASALALIAGLLNDPDLHTQTQAALVLAHWGGDPQAIDKLQQLYPQVNRRLKEAILDSLGKIPAADCRPFLVQILASPSQSLRLIAAASLAQSLYN